MNGHKAKALRKAVLRLTGRSPLGRRIYEKINKETIKATGARRVYQDMKP